MSKTKYYRGADSYKSKDPAKRAKQLENLRIGRGLKGQGKRIKPLAVDNDRLVSGLKIKDWAERYFVIKDTDGVRRPVKILDWQEKIFKELFEAESRPSFALLGMPKKSGKSTLAAIIALYTLFNKDGAEIYIIGPDKEQGNLVVFNKIRMACRLNKVLSDRVTITMDRIEAKEGGGFVKLLSCNITNAGLEPDLVLFDELWQFTSTEAKRTIDELTNVPKKDSLVLITTYAGFENETDTHLWRWYKEGKAGKLEGYFLWRTDYEGVPWVTEGYLNGQRKRLSDSAYRRFHCNEWVESEEAFITEEIINRNTAAGLMRGEIAVSPVYVGVDIGTKDDCSAVAVVGKGFDGKLRLYDHHVWKIVKGTTLDIEATVEAWIKELKVRGYRIGEVIYDPSQFIRSSQALARAGFRMREFTQSGEPMIKASETLKSLLNAGRLELYDNHEVKEHLLNAAAKETGRGIRIIKGNGQAKKIDLCIALAMAVFGAAERFLVPERTIKAGRNPVYYPDKFPDNYIRI